MHVLVYYSEIALRWLHEEKQQNRIWYYEIDIFFVKKKEKRKVE